MSFIFLNVTDGKHGVLGNILRLKSRTESLVFRRSHTVNGLFHLNGLIKILRGFSHWFIRRLRIHLSAREMMRDPTKLVEHSWIQEIKLAFDCIGEEILQNYWIHSCTEFFGRNAMRHLRGIFVQIMDQNTLHQIFSLLWIICRSGNCEINSECSLSISGITVWLISHVINNFKHSILHNNSSFLLLHSFRKLYTYACFDFTKIKHSMLKNRHKHFPFCIYSGFPHSTFINALCDLACAGTTLHSPNLSIFKSKNKNCMTVFQ